MPISINTLPQQGQPYAGDDIFEYAKQHGFGELHYKVDPATGMQAIIAIHNTKLGPALGGCRFIAYANATQACLDAMRLARGMSYKSALAHLPLGGGKSVILYPPTSFDRAAYMQAFGKFVHELNGRYITALDSGTDLDDMDIIRQQTPYVASSSTHEGDPSPATATGVLRGIEASVAFKLGKPSLVGIHIAIQGLGHVGHLLAQHVHQMGAKLTVADICPDKAHLVATQTQAQVVSHQDIHKIPCDVFVPSALGAVINDQTIGELQTSIIAGAANNQLAHRYHGLQLHERGILYAPDYVINAGGVIFAAGKYYEHSSAEIDAKINCIHATLLTIYERSVQENLPTSTIADILAEEKIG